MYSSRGGRDESVCERLANAAARVASMNRTLTQNSPRHRPCIVVAARRRGWKTRLRCARGGHTLGGMAVAAPKARVFTHASGLGDDGAVSQSLMPADTYNSPYARKAAILRGLGLGPVNDGGRRAPDASTVPNAELVLVHTAETRVEVNLEVNESRRVVSLSLEFVPDGTLDLALGAHSSGLVRYLSTAWDRWARMPRRAMRLLQAPRREDRRVQGVELHPRYPRPRPEQLVLQPRPHHPPRPRPSRADELLPHRRRHPHLPSAPPRAPRRHGRHRPRSRRARARPRVRRERQERLPLRARVPPGPSRRTVLPRRVLLRQQRRRARARADQIVPRRHPRRGARRGLPRGKRHGRHLLGRPGRVRREHPRGSRRRVPVEQWLRG